MNVVIIGNFSYPKGMAGTKRIQHFIDYLKEKNVKIKLLLIRQGQETLNKGEGAGWHKGVYYFTIGSHIKMNIALLFSIPGYLIGGVKKLYQWKSHSKKNILFVYSGIDIEKIFFVVFARLIGYKIIVDILEDFRSYDETTHFLSYIKRLSNTMSESALHLLSDGIIVISNYLYKKFESKNLKMPLVHIPISAKATSIINGVTSPRISDKKILTIYSGSFGKKDGVENIVTAFKKLATKRDDCELILTGKGNNLQKILSMTEKVNNIHYLGYLEDDQFYSFISQADILCVARIDSHFANAGFPFKLGEYLSTGKPVIATDVGDIKDYLVNMEDAIIIQPGNSNQIADAVELLADNKNLSKKIGSSGKSKCYKYFNYDKNGKKLHHLLEDL